MPGREPWRAASRRKVAHLAQQRFLAHGSRCAGRASSMRGVSKKSVHARWRRLTSGPCSRCDRSAPPPRLGGPRSRRVGRGAQTLQRGWQHPTSCQELAGQRRVAAPCRLGGRPAFVFSRLFAPAVSACRRLRGLGHQGFPLCKTVAGASPPRAGTAAPASGTHLARQRYRAHQGC